MEEGFQLHRLCEANGNCHSALWVPKELPCRFGCPSALPTNDIYNIVLAEVSSSMESYWSSLVSAWNTYIKNKLTGRTNIYTFGDHVSLKRCEPDLLEEDMECSERVNFTNTVRALRKRVDTCAETNVRIFIICNSAHDVGEPYPESEIRKMKPSSTKSISVYIFGIGPDFPARYCCDVRSRMHNGNSNTQVLFWAKDESDIAIQACAIGDDLMPFVVTLKLNVEGYLLPGLANTRSIHLGEWVYFEQAPHELSTLYLSVNDGDNMAIEVEKVMESKFSEILAIFQQWNSILLREQQRGQSVFHQTFDLMESFYSQYCINFKKTQMTQCEGRKVRKKLKDCERVFRTVMNQIKALTGDDGSWKSEREFAEMVLKTTVTDTKLEKKLVNLRSYGPEKYREGQAMFKEIYEKAKPSILALPDPEPDELCRITQSSTLAELKRTDFQNTLEKEKYEFLRDFTMSGIPIYSVVDSVSQMNPWSLNIKRILIEPYAVVSQQALESCADANGFPIPRQKNVELEKGKKNTTVNAIIPTIPESAAEVLSPLVQSDTYAMMATFCILKHPYIIDQYAHLAALGCAWIRTIREFPKKNRPEFANRRLRDITATARLYLDRSTVKNYNYALVNQPEKALLPESQDEMNNKIIRCMSLVKPAFFLFLMKESLSVDQMRKIFLLMVFEFFNRCLVGFMKRKEYEAPFAHFFCSEIEDSKMKKEWLEKHQKAIASDFQITHGNLLETFFTQEDMISRLRRDPISPSASIVNDKGLLQDVSVKVNMKKVNKLKNFFRCGDVRLSTFEIIGQEVNLPSETIEEALSPAKVSIYISEALRRRKCSKDRLSEDLPSYEKAMKFVKEHVIRECASMLTKPREDCSAEEMVKEEWKKAYLQVHATVAIPLTQQQIIDEAQANGIKVTQETFHQVYKYDGRMRLLRNACQIKDCPHFLIPHTNASQHLAFERKHTPQFPHSFHIVSRKFCHKGVDAIMKELSSGKYIGRQERKKGTPPDAESLQNLRGHMHTLSQIYSETDR